MLFNEYKQKNKSNLKAKVGGSEQVGLHDQLSPSITRKSEMKIHMKDSSIKLSNYAIYIFVTLA